MGEFCTHHISNYIYDEGKRVVSTVVSNNTVDLQQIAVGFISVDVFIAESNYWLDFIKVEFTALII